MGLVKNEAIEPTPGDIDALLEYIPRFEADGFVFSEFHAPADSLPHWIKSDVAIAFVDAVYQNGWVVDFDWKSWADEVRKYQDSPDLVRSADVRTVRRLLTCHILGDRVHDGHLKDIFESGHLMTILWRLRELRRDLGSAAA